MAGRRRPSESKTDEDQDISFPDRVKISPEERAILLDCRRHSMIRGFVSGSAISMAIYWFKAQGRVPAFVTRQSSLVYGLAFFGAFVAGAGSYQKTCFRRIMALENSALADIYRKTSSHIEKEMKKAQQNKKSKDPPPFPSSLPKQRPKASPTPPPPDVNLSEGPSINMRTYHKDRAMLESQEEDVEQPSAFSGGGDGQAPPPASFPPSASRDEDSDGRRRYKSFDEIREENRRRNNQPRYPSSSSQSTNTKPEKKRRNKYGDIIED